MQQIKERTRYLDSLKGICAICVIVFHFLLLFKWEGYIGWNNNIPEKVTAFDYYFQYFPYSILTNNSFPLYVFYGIISFSIANSYFKDFDNNKIISQAKKRYFRFFPMVLGSFLLSWVCYVMNLYNFDEFLTISGNNWVLGRIGLDTSLKVTLYSGTIGAYFKTSEYVMSLWCLNYLFLGSYLTYGLLLLSKYIKPRWLVYITSSLILFFIDQAYLTFIFGIIAADLYTNRPVKTKKNAYLCLFSGVIVGLFPPVLLVNIVKIDTLYAVGTLLVLISLDMLCKESKLMNNIVLSDIGKNSFSYIVANHFALAPVSTGLYVLFDKAGLNNTLAIIIIAVIYIISNIVIAKVFSLVFVPISNKLCKIVAKYLNFQ